MAPESQKVNAVVLAGRANDGRLKECASEAWEALIDIGGRPMVSWLIESLLGSEHIGHVTLVAPKAVFEADFKSDRVSLVEPGDSMVGNAVIGAKASPPGDMVLLCTSDIPLVTSSMLDRFIEQCREKPGDFYYPVVPKEVAEKRFPEVKRTYATIREGTFTGGNIILVRSDKVEGAAERADRWVQYRKSPIKQASLLGWGFAIKLVLHTLTITELERTISNYFSFQARAIISNDPEIGVDVDKPSDLHLVRNALVRNR